MIRLARINLFLFGFLLSGILWFSCKDSSNQQAVEELLKQQKKLTQEKETLQKEKQALSEKAWQLQKKADTLSVQILQKKISHLEKQKSIFESRIQMLQDSLAKLDEELNDLIQEQKELQKQKEFAEKNREDAKQLLQSDAEEIDAKIRELEDEKFQTQKKIQMLQNRLLISQQKRDAFEKELHLLETELNDFIRRNAPETEMDSLNQEIQLVRNNLAQENARILEIKTRLENLHNAVAALDSQIARLNLSLKESYQRKTVIDDFVENEIKRIHLRLKQLETEMQKIQALRDLLAGQLTELKDQHTATVNQIEAIENQMKTLAEREEIVETPQVAEQKEAPEKMEQVPVEKESKGFTSATILIITIILIIVLLLIVFYLIGKRKKNRRTKN